MYKEYADYALKFLKKQKVDYGEVRLEESEGDGLVLKNGTPEISGFESSAGMGIRFLIQRSLGFVAINEFEKKKIQDVILEGLKLVRKGRKLSANTGLSEEKAYQKNYKVSQKIKMKDVDPKEKMKLLRGIDSEIKSARGRYLSLATGTKNKYFINTEGTRITSEVPGSYFTSFTTVKVKGKSAQKLFQKAHSGGYEHIKRWNLPKTISEQVKAMQMVLKKGKKPPRGKLDFVVGPEITGIMVHESVGHPFEADRIMGREAAQAGESFVNKGMLGEQIGSEHVTVVDDPVLDNGPGYYRYDDEGVKAERRELIKEGKINEFLHNRETAFEMGVKSNGASRAESFDREPLIRMAHTFLLLGKFSEEELIKDVKLGIYLKDFTEWNIDDKRFQMKYVGNEAYLIKNGKIAHPLISPVLEIQTPDLWKSVDGVARKTAYDGATCGKGEPMQGAPVWLGGPSMRIRNVNVN